MPQDDSFGVETPAGKLYGTGSNTSILIAILASTICLGYIVHTGFDKNATALASGLTANATASTKLSKALTVLTVSTTYDHSKLAFDGYINQCIDVLKQPSRKEELEYLRKNWHIEQIKVHCPWVPYPPRDARAQLRKELDPDD